MQGMKATARFGPIVNKEGMSVVFSRLVSALSIKHEGADKDRDIILSLCITAVPHTHYKEELSILKGKKEAPVCDHINVPENKREQWIKHTCCGAWEKLS
jgi:hypothetical protein